MNKIRSILFVCTGNSCRSIMAEGLLKKRLEGLGKMHIKVMSAGVTAIEGLPPTLETIEVMKGEDIDVSAFKAARLSEDIINEADLILVMENMHKDEVIKMVPDAASKTHLLKEYGVVGKKNYSTGITILDPIGRPIKEYEYTLAAIKDEIERIAKIL
ncbi:MAG: low molecular weight protein arginine phosphatase [Candidatus Omnitrophica bacterium]|nr:low molecular weight protein arginine phosphatase [Candidatus Omnitrophota bacterium]